MCTYLIFFHNIAQIASVKFRTDSPGKLVMNKFVSTKILQEENSPTSFLSSFIQYALHLCTYIAVFSAASDGTAVERQI